MRRKLFRIVVCLFLVFAIAFENSGIYEAIETQKVQYISDVAVGTKEQLETKGYTVVESNVNEGGTATYIGYKYTDDPDDAIVDMAALGMYDGFSVMSYRDQLMNDNADVTNLAEQLQTVIEQFAAEYNAGNAYARYACETLNLLTIPDENSDSLSYPLGDYFVDGDCSLRDCKRIVLMSSNAVLSLIYNELTLGLTDDLTKEGNISWLDRLCNNGPFDFSTTAEDGTVTQKDEGTINAIYQESYDNLYSQRAKKLYDEIAEFAADYETALKETGGAENMSAPSDGEAKEDATEVIDCLVEGETIEMESDDGTELTTGDSSDDSSADIVEETTEDSETVAVVALYEALNAKDAEGNPVYPYGTHEDGSTRTLAEFFIEVGTSDEGTNAYRELYPLIAVQDGTSGTVPLNDAQEIMLNLVGFSSILSIAFGNAETLSKIKSNSDAKIAEIKGLNGGESLSIWFDVNTELYDQDVDGIYWTSNLARQTGSAGTYDVLTKAEGQKDLTQIQEIWNAMLWLAGAGISLLYLTAAACGAVLHISMYSALLTVVANCLAAATVSVMSVIAVGATILAVAAIVVAIVLAIIWLIKKFSSDDEPDLVMTDIPSIVYDYGEDTDRNGIAVRYAVARYPDTNEAANLNLGVKNTPWLAIYYTKDTNLGDPITVEVENGKIVTDPFVVQKESLTAPSGYSPLCFFDESGAADLNSGRSGVSGVYCFIHKLRDESDAGGEYISDVILSSADSESAARAGITKMKGYQVLDYNLTSDGSVATYIGYKTTSDATNAITDLRLGYSTGIDPDGGKTYFGGASYGCCGNVGDLLLFETKYACAGTPILAGSLTITTSLSGAPDGYEPVNLFCGGPALDFNNCDNWKVGLNDDQDEVVGGKEEKKYWTSHAFLYFQPSVMYKASDEGATAYLGGLAFFSGENTENYMKEMGWSLVQYASSYNLAGTQSGQTYLCYSTTYNPYRAIYDIQYYCAEPNAQNLQAFLSLGTGTAAAVDVFYGNSSIRMLRISHAYRSNITYEGGTCYEPSDYVAARSDETSAFSKKNGGSATEWYNINGKETPCNTRCVGLYVVGNSASDISTADPILVSELTITNSANYNPNKYTPVRSITDNYSEQGANLALYDACHKGKMYLYVKRPDANVEKPTYIASVTVSYQMGTKAAEEKTKIATSVSSVISDDEEETDTSGCSNPYDQAVYSLTGNGAGTLYEINLTGDTYWDTRTTDYSYEFDDAIRPRYYKTTCVSHDTDYTVALVWVTYTDKETEALSDLYLYQSDSTKAPASLKTSAGVSVSACGDAFQTSAEQPYYFLMASKNNGSPMRDIVIDETVMDRGYWTTLSTDGKVSNYQRYFIKTKHGSKNSQTSYITGIYFATGKTKKEAMLSLLNQGCRYSAGVNLSPDGAGDPIYIGYQISTSYEDAYSGMVLEDCGQNSNVSAVNFGAGHYEKLTDSLNSGVYDSLICLFGTKQKSVAKGSSLLSNESKWRYISDIAFYTDTDLNSYATGKKDLDDIEDEEEREYVESLIYDDNDNAVKWDIVTNSDYEIVNCNIKALDTGVLDTKATKMYMYVHYSNNATPNQNYLSGSIFARSPMMSVVFCSGGVLVALAALYYYRKKRNVKGTEQH